MKHVFKMIYKDRAGICQNCGRAVPFIAHSFAHIKSKRLLTNDQKKDPKFILLVCPDLHGFQTTGADNLMRDFCVDLFIVRFGHLIIFKNERGKNQISFKNFYQGLLDEIQLQF